MIAAPSHIRLRATVVVVALLALILALIPATRASAAGEAKLTGSVLLAGITTPAPGDVDIYYQKLVATNTWGPETFGTTTGASGSW